MALSGEGPAAGNSASLRRELKRAGLSNPVVEAAWPSWWSDEAETSPSARAELRFAIARRLGLSAPSLLGDKVQFAWRDRARYKHLAGVDEHRLAALTSFGVAVGHSLLRATPDAGPVPHVTAADLRRALTAGGAVVDLNGLLALCWSIGLPVAHLRLFPLKTKSMHAMVVRGGERAAVLLAKDSVYPAPVAFTLAHEIAHAFLGHLGADSVLLDVSDPANGADGDADEVAADRFALELLTGSPEPDVRSSVAAYNSVQLADAAVRAGPDYGIEPGTLALCLAFRTSAWPVAMASLRRIYGRGEPVWLAVNRLAAQQLDWDSLQDDAASFLRTVMGVTGG